MGELYRLNKACSTAKQNQVSLLSKGRVDIRQSTSHINHYEFAILKLLLYDVGDFTFNFFFLLISLLNSSSIFSSVKWG